MSVSRAEGPLGSLEQAIEHAVHLLPTQGPISVFVHHNTLHAFEERPFERALREAGRIYDCRPLLEEHRYQRLMVEGRFGVDDLRQVLLEDLGEGARHPIDGLGTRLDIRLALLQHPNPTAASTELRWVLAESGALQRFPDGVAPEQRQRLLSLTRDWVLRDLPASEVGLGPRLAEKRRDLGTRFGGPETWSDTTWETACLEFTWALCCDRTEALPQADLPGGEHVSLDRLVAEHTRHRPGQLVDDFLVPFLSAFCDQGFAAWPLPGRDRGLLACFRALYARGVGLPAWLRGLRRELVQGPAAGLSAMDSIRASLELLGLEGHDAARHVQDTLLELRGFAGMVHQLETNADWVPHPLPPGSLREYLAVRLMAQRHAAAHCLGIGPKEVGAQLRGRLEALRTARPAPRPATVEQRASLVFQMAPLQGWDPGRLARVTGEQWSELVAELEDFDPWARRHVHQRAYERRFRDATLEALLGHRTLRRRAPRPTASPAAYQVFLCIDDREESLRRHLEELDSTCETVGVAGFFGVAMYYRGVTEAYYRPLCPVNVTPDHYVVEEPSYSVLATSASRARWREQIGRLAHRTHRGSRTVLGGLVTAVLGSLATAPLLLRVFLPRHTSRLVQTLGIIVRPPLTRLRLRRAAGAPVGPEPGGFTVEEMAGIVEAILTLTGKREDLAPLVLILGHGSSSLNNPHRAAYDCGACGGGRGGPNGRAFAEMANDPEVRAVLAARGLVIPEGTRFVGGYHNTGDDSIELYDLDEVPASHRAVLDHARGKLEVARRRNAQERCRRFVSAPLDLDPDAALAHVEGRTEDLSQTRPELGHATNALCFVGRREWSRGLFLDRRAFLTSYDPGQDDGRGSVLERLVQAVIPVCAGINLEYFFSYVDPEGYGCGTKLPHNLMGLVGVMSGAASDLRTGLPWQMVEIHEPLRILFVIESRPEVVEGILDRNPALSLLVRNGWVQLATFDDGTGEVRVFGREGFAPHAPRGAEPAVAPSSWAWYRGQRGHLEFASVGADAHAAAGMAAAGAAVEVQR